MASAKTSRPGRSLWTLLGLLAVLFGLVAAGVQWSDGQWSPKLALDLEGGTEIVLRPVPTEGEQTLTQENLTEAVNIIRQRVDGSGVAEAEVSTQGGQNIVVAIPGQNPDEETIQLVQASAQLQFRAVLAAQPTGVAAAPTTPAPTGTPTPGATPTPTGTATPGATATQPAATVPPSATPSATASSNGKNLPAWARPAAATTPTPTAPAATESPGATTPAAPAPSPTDASDLSQVTPELQAAFDAQTCTDLGALAGVIPPADQPFVTCSDDGTEKYILGPAEVLGQNIRDASAGLGQTSQGASSGQWVVNLTFDGTGTRQFADVTTRLFQFPNTDVRNRFAVVLDGTVITAPTTNARIPNGQAEISGSFTPESAKALASQLKFGALPISFQTQTIQQISATLGAEQLRNGLLAGLIGLALVVVYSLLQYRALGLVTVASLGVVALVTYGFIVLLGWRQGYRLSLPGVAGLIVAIGVTADSFIVYFERIRDEVRDGKALPVAVEAAWARARRTIIVSDAVSFLAAVVLYTLAVGGVRGFAFTLGLTTLVDILVTFLFTKPMVTLLSRRTFFASGHKLSGFDARHLGRTVAYAGRGRVRPKAAKGASPARTIAERRAAAARGDSPSDGVPDDAGPDGTGPDDAGPDGPDDHDTTTVGGSRGGRDA